MKKSAFKVLCMVLIIALLAPKAFAATPAPEAPLADAATVERVKQEIADGEITDMEDLFLVAYQHLGADLEEEGMTAYLNEDGTLGITQIISSEKKMSRGGEVEEKTFAVSTIGFFDVNRRDLTITEYYPSPHQSSVTVDGTGVTIVHTSYYKGKITPGQFNDDASAKWEIRINYMVTSIAGAGITNHVTKLVQRYERWAIGWIDLEESKTTMNLVNGPYSFTPAVIDWVEVPDYNYTKLVTRAEIYITGFAEPIELTTTVPLHDTIPY